MLNGVEATVEMFWPLTPGVVTCRLSCEAPKERWNGMFDLGATVLSARFLDNFSNTYRNGNRVMLPLKEYQGFSPICDLQFVLNVGCLVLLSMAYDEYRLLSLPQYVENEVYDGNEELDVRKGRGMAQ